MGIEKIRSDYGSNSAQNLLQYKPVKNRVYFGEVKDSTSFTGTAAVVTNATKPLRESVLELLPKSAKNIFKMHEGMGEIQNQLINAIGTGLIAPIFIKFNPLSDTDENTRTYTAWRQPVSAVLAVGTQCAIVKPFNDIIRWMSDIGYLGQKYNASLFPSDNYIIKTIKEDNKGKHLSKSELNTELESRKKTYAANLKEMIENDKIVFKKTSTKGISNFEMPEQDFKQLFDDTLNNIIKAEENAKLNAIKVKLPKKLERNIFYHNHPEEAKKVLQKASSKIIQSYSQSDITTEKLAIICKDIENEFKTIKSELKKEMKTNPAKRDINPELINIVDDLKACIHANNEDTSVIRILDTKINNMIDNVNLMASKKSTKEIIEHVNTSIYKRTNAIDEVISALTEVRNKLNTSGITVKQAQEIIDERIQIANNDLLSKLNAKGISEISNTPEFIESAGARLKQKAGSIAGSIADQMKSLAKANIDGYKRWTGLGVSLAILPVTCWLLNRIYPWFMDLAFPNLSNKQPKKADTVEIQNTKKAEVK